MSRYRMVIKQGALSPSIQIGLTNNDGTSIDLSDAVSITFTMVSRETELAIIDTAAMDVDNAAQGLISYQWIAGDTDTVGIYDAEVKVNWPDDDTPEYFPHNDHITVRIIPLIV